MKKIALFVFSVGLAHATIAAVTSAPAHATEPYGTGGWGKPWGGPTQPTPTNPWPVPGR